MAFASNVGHRFDSLKSDVGGVVDQLAHLQAQQDKILSAIEHLRVSSEKVGKKDWSSAAMSTAMGIVASAVLPADVARQLALDLMMQLSHIRLLPPG
jgi:tRNA A37 threonylcarbamoyltransferase TsaD